jgi:plastocyanin
MTGYTRGGLKAAAVVLATAAPIGHLALAATVRVDVKGLSFTPAEITAHVGDTIEWMNEDFVAHTATARDGAWDLQLPPHASGQTVVKTVGKIAYYCRYHPNMKGEISVAPQ